MDALALIAERRIEAAIAAGELDDLPGEGHPLPPDPFARVPTELRMGVRLLHNSDCLPPELEARSEVARLGSLLACAADEAERAELSRLRADAELRYHSLVERRFG